MPEQAAKCKFCLEEFTSKDKWKAHVSIIHKAMAYVCDLCPKVFYSEKEYLRHFDLEHSDDFNRHTCSYCGLSYKWFKILEQHIQKKHHIEKKIQCTDCGEEFYNTKAYESHLQLKHAPGRKMYKCKKCHRKFTAKASVPLHDKFDHNPKRGFDFFKEYVLENLNLESEDMVQDLSKCVKCNLEYSSAMYLFKHFKSNHNKRLYHKCCMCDEAVYNTKAGLSIHLFHEHGIPREHTRTCLKCSVPHEKSPVKTKEIKKQQKSELPNSFTKTNKVIAVNKKSSPSWRNNFISENIPNDTDLKCVSDVELSNLKHNIRSLFHVLSTVPPSKLKGTDSCHVKVGTIYSTKNLMFSEDDCKQGDDIKATNNFIASDNEHNGLAHVVNIDENAQDSCIKINDTLVDDNNDENKDNENIKERKIYQCQVCKDKFTLRKDLRTHMMCKHETNTHMGKNNNQIKSHTPKCLNNKEIISKIDINIHTIDCKSDEGSFDSDLLEESTDKSITWVEPDIKTTKNETTPAIVSQMEIMQKHVDEKYICDICQTEFQNLLLIQNHMIECHLSGINGCQNEHKKIHTGNNSENGITTEYVCRMCKKPFDNMRGLYLHRLRKHGIKNIYRCKKCNYQSSNKRIFKRHTKACNGLNEVITEKDSVPTNHDKENDMKLKEDEYEKMKTALLELCKREIEQKTHHEEPNRVYKCLKCNDKFPKRSLLLKHIRIKHKVPLYKIYKCDKCNAVFKMEDKLKQHTKLKHKISVLPRKENNLPVIKINRSKLSPVKLDGKKLPQILSNVLSVSILNGTLHNCKICNSYFPSSELLHRHIQWEHTRNVNLHKCGQCNQVLYSVEDLDLHMNSLHANEAGVFKWKKHLAFNYEHQTDV